MKEIKLANNKGVVLVDDSDFEELNQYHWCLSIWGYATRRVLKSERVKYKTANILMHRQIMGVIDPKSHVDHINQIPLDNRRENLRFCSMSQNKWNMRKRADNKSGFKGVRFRARFNRWVAVIGRGGKKIHLGYFGTREEAALVYNQAAQKIHGEFACLNKIG